MKNKQYKPTLYIPIEIKARELNSQLLLTLFAIKKGFRVYIAPKVEIHKVISSKKKKGGVYLYKGCHDKKFSKYIKERCDSSVIIDQELSPNINNHDALVKLRITPDSLPFIDKYFVVNNSVLDSVLKFQPNLKGRIFITGWPRIELSKPKYNNLYLTDLNDIKDKYGEYLLFTSDFGYLSHDCIKKRITQERNQINSRDDLSLDYDNMEEKASKNFNYELKETIAFLKELNNDASIPKIIVRPHPSEDVKIWHQIFSNQKNIHIKSAGDVMPWILASKGLIHRGSTTAVQALMNNIPVFYYVAKEEAVRKNISYDISTKVKNLSELRDNYTSYQPLINTTDKDFSKKLALDKNAPQEVINHLLAKDLSKENIYTPSLFMHIKFILVKILIKIRRKSMKHGIQSSRRKLGRSINKRNIIQPLKEISSSIGNDFNRVKVNKIANSLWVIEEKEI